GPRDGRLLRDRAGGSTRSRKRRLRGGRHEPQRGERRAARRGDVEEGSHMTFEHVMEHPVADETIAGVPIERDDPVTPASPPGPAPARRGWPLGPVPGGCRWPC